MKLIVLVDNNTLTDRYFVGEPGLSFFITDRNARILFDTGYSNIFITNAIKLNINLLNLTHVALSHGHIDHVGGMQSLISLYTEANIEGKKWRKPSLVTHPLSLAQKILPGIGSIGQSLSSTIIEQYFDIETTTEPVWITDKLAFLGQIPRTNEFESAQLMGKILNPSGNQNDHLLDDSALAYKAREGIVVISGCAHSGICNTIQHAQNVCNEERVIDVIGGMHMLNASNDRLLSTRLFLSKLNLNKLHPCHCTDLQAKIALSKGLNIFEVGVGTTIFYK